MKALLRFLGTFIGTLIAITIGFIIIAIAFGIDVIVIVFKLTVIGFIIAAIILALKTWGPKIRDIFMK